MKELLIVAVALLLVVVVLLIVLLVKKQKGTDVSHISDVITRENQHSREIDVANSRNLISVIDRSMKVQNEKFIDLERRVEDLTRTNELRFAEMGKSISERVRELSDKNEKQLEEMRIIVDEKLQSTLERRLDGSYKIISDNLDAVSTGIGEVKKLAESVDDLKKVFANTKLRGTWGEVQLNALLEQMLAKNQFVKNYRINPKVDNFVDFAIVLPDKDGEITYLPIDSKFPIEEYRRILTYEEIEQEREKSIKAFVTVVKKEALSIAEKYILPPKTTDFAIMYMPVEGLYAEALKNDELMSYLHKIRIMICGPNTLGALLNSLQTGFKTLAIEKRSQELWQLLSAFKVEFRRFNLLLEKTGKKLQEAQDTLEDAGKRTRQIDKKLSSVSEISDIEAEKLLSDEQ